MRRFIQLSILFLFSISAKATTYYISPSGNDSNNGLTSGAPWLSPNHSVNCGDVLTAAAGTYSESNFGFGKWGTVSCSAGNNVAWVACATFDTCKMSGSTTPYAMYVTASYWGVQGFEVTTSYTYQPCFAANPPTTSANIHHIIFANNVANGCIGSGFVAYNNGAAGVDYFVVIGNIAYNAAQGSSECYSGIGVVVPAASDTLPGTHIYVAGNFSYANFDPNPCAGTAPTDGEGVIFDTWNGLSYTQQAAIVNNMFLGNGGRGIEINGNSNISGASPPASSASNIYVKNNTVWGNNGDTNQNASDCGEIMLEGFLSPTIYLVQNAQVYNNLVSTNSATGCGSYPVYALSIDFANATNVFYQNWAYSAAGYNYQGHGLTIGPNNTLGTNPSFANPSVPGAPTCGSFASVIACAAAMIANFTPTNITTKSYGYQVPTSALAFDPLFPQWLCNVTNLPSGLIQMGCLNGSAFSGATMSGTTVH